MYAAGFDYHRPTSLAEAAELLRKNPDARLIAGGHSLLPAMKFRLASPTALVDIGRLSELAGIRPQGDGVEIGALTRHAAVASSETLRRRWPLLAETAAQVGDIQVRNRGTLGGSLAHADPAADLPTAVVALRASLVASNGSASREIPAESFFKDLFTTDLKPGEILTAVRIPGLAPGSGGVYLKHRHPASSYAVVGVAALVTLAKGRCSAASLVVGGVRTIPARAKAAEGALLGQAPDPATIASAAGKVGEALREPLSDPYASGEFRVHLAGVLLRRALSQAFERAQAAV